MNKMNSMNIMNNISETLQNNVIDHTNNNITYGVTFINNLGVLHIYNPNLENITIFDYNKKFFSKLCDGLFKQDKHNKNKGCFNHEASDNDYKYTSSDNELLNHFLNIEYTFILFNENLDPLCNLCVNNNTIYNVCTNYKYRNKGFMTLLIKHILKLIKFNKLKNEELCYDKLSLNISKINPIKKKLIKYYQTFGFNQQSENDSYISMSLKPLN